MVQWKFKNPPINRLRVVAQIKQWEENYNLQWAQRNTWTFQCTQNKVYVWLHPPAFSLRNDLNVYSKPCSPQAITVDKASFCCRGSLWWPTDNLSVVWRLWKLEWYMLTCSLSLCFYVTWKKKICRTRRRYPSMSWNFRKTVKSCIVSPQARLPKCIPLNGQYHTIRKALPSFPSGRNFADGL